jgi:hypothetical protein
MSQTLRRWTSADLDLFPEDNKRREIIGGELYVSKMPSAPHQMVCPRLGGNSWRACLRICLPWSP